MEKIERKVICDSCGKEIVEGHFHFSKLYMKTFSYGGGSMGGNEDYRDIYADLCEHCCCEIESFLTNTMKIKREKGKPFSHDIVKK